MAVDWAASVLDEPVIAVNELSGGLTSTMLALTHRSGARSVLRLMANEPWRMHGAELTRRERATQLEFAATPVPAPTSLGIDADGVTTGVAAHLMTRRSGAPTRHVGDPVVIAMAEMLAVIHEVRPAGPYRAYQSWACDYWMVLDAVGFLPPPGRPPLFGSAVELERLDDWLGYVVGSYGRR